MKSPKILHLTLKKSWFDLMINGKKTTEYRKPSDWIKQRLIDKDYDLIRFVNGYGSEKPFFMSIYLGYEVAKKDEKIMFEEQEVTIKKGDYKIFLGDIIEKGNL